MGRRNGYGKEERMRIRESGERRKESEWSIERVVETKSEGWRKNERGRNSV